MVDIDRKNERIFIDWIVSNILNLDSSTYNRYTSTADAYELKVLPDALKTNDYIIESKKDDDYNYYMFAGICFKHKK